MKGVRFFQAFVQFVPRASVLFAGSFVLAALMAISGAMAQNANPPKNKLTVMDGYNVHQSFDLGGHVANTSGSGAMFDTLVNLQSGPRFLNHTLELHPVGGSKHTLFDSLFEASTGYGGDPNDFTTLRASKGRLYDFQGIFRRDRQYFDYDLLGNPLVPAGLTTANGYTYPQVMNAPHLFNTVRRMTDVNLTLMPISKVSFRAGYSQNINQGPSYSSIHEGSDALLLQNWRNSTDSFVGAVDWKPFHRTTLTYEEHVTHYKGDTNWQIAGLNLQLSNGTPVSLGFDNVTAIGATTANSGCGANPAILSNTTTPATANPCVNGYLGYARSEPTRTLFPTEEFRFQSSTLKNVQMTGRVLYTGATMKLPAYNESFNGLESRSVSALPSPPVPTSYCSKATVAGVTTYSDCLNVATITGYANGKRINTSADFGIVWEVSRKVSLSDQYDFQNFRQPAIGYLSEVDQYSASMLTAPAITGAPAITSANNFLGQKMQTNTVTAAWEAAGWAQVSLGYRYRARSIGYIESVATDALPTGANYTQEIHEQGGLFGLVLRPSKEWKINTTAETTWADGAFTQINPRQSQHYQVRTTYRPKNWATFSGAFNDLEKRDNVINVNYLAHTRNFSAGASLAPNEHYGLELNYGYVDVFSRSTNCFGDPVASAPPDATPIPAPATCGNLPSGATAAFYGTSYFDTPTQFGSAAFVLSPVKQFRTSFGYRVSAVEGQTEFLNPLEVPGSLQSRYQTPYVNLAWKLTPAWMAKGDYNYYGYGESSAVGPTAPRNFHGNIYTLGVHYEY
jgi:hypothetical protein